MLSSDSPSFCLCEHLNASAVPGGFKVLLYPSDRGGDEEAPEGGQMKPDKQMSAVITALQRADGRAAGIRRRDMKGVGLFPGGGKLKGTNWRED